MRAITIFILLIIINYPLFMQQKFNPPETKKIKSVDSIHGFVITDYYQWLEDKNNQEVSDWSHKQHDYTVEYIHSTTKEIPGLKDEIRAYLDRDWVSAPFYHGTREFFWSRKKGEQHNKLYTKYKGKDILLFDPLAIDPSGKSATGGVSFNRDGSKVAIGLQFKGNEIDDYRIIDTKNGKQEGDLITGLSGFSWTKDEKHAYLTVRTKEMIDKQIPLQTYLHKIGDDRKNDKFLLAPKDAKDEANIWDEEYEDVTFISEGDFYSNSLKIKKTGTDEEPKLIFESRKYKADPHARNGKIFFYTNYEAPNFKIMVADINKPEFENWTVFYPEQETVLEGYVITSDYVVIQYKKDVLSRLKILDLNGQFIKEFDLTYTADVAGMSYHKESNTIYVTLNTFISTSVVYKLDGKTLNWEFFYQDKAPIDSKDIESKLVFYYSKDSTRIPMFLVYKKGVKLDGKNPTLLYGYGGFNISMQPGYVGTTGMFINRGGVYAIACLRGGNEYGEKWHWDGMLKKKQNTFDDFIAAAEYLINEKYTTPVNMGIKGGSNGGLLIGAAITQRPDLFKAAICAVPLLDMLRYHKFLIARYWIPEYGDPDKKDDFLNILKYSPYHNIRTGFNYPITLVKAGENDSRVDPLHAKKFVAALQNNPGQTNPIMLYVDFDSGHGGGQSIDQQVRNIEIEWQWIMNQLGIKRD